jgi:hypothetical protein
MLYNDLTPIFLAISAISWGAFFGALGNKLVGDNYSSNWKYAFYFLAVLALAAGIVGLIVVQDKNMWDWITLITLIVSGPAVFAFTFGVLDKKTIYPSSDLNPVVNRFTEHADKSEIKLFGGDLDFFGKTPSDMDVNKQYSVLKSLNFKRVLILCEQPRDNSTRIRYGKIMHEISGAEIRFYHPDEADLRVRGRMKKVDGVERVLIYSKQKSGYYEAIETDSGNSKGAMYGNIWYLVWTLANRPDQSELSGYINLFRGK